MTIARPQKQNTHTGNREGGREGGRARATKSDIDMPNPTPSAEHLMKGAPQRGRRTQETFSGFNNPKRLLRQKIANNLSRLSFSLRNEISLARLFSEALLRLF